MQARVIEVPYTRYVLILAIFVFPGENACVQCHNKLYKVCSVFLLSCSVGNVRTGLLVQINVKGIMKYKKTELLLKKKKRRRRGAMVRLKYKIKNILYFSQLRDSCTRIKVYYCMLHCHANRRYTYIVKFTSDAGLNSYLSMLMF